MDHFKTLCKVVFVVLCFFGMNKCITDPVPATSVMGIRSKI
jgi:hypothetical protein